MQGVRSNWAMLNDPRWRWMRRAEEPETVAHYWRDTEVRCLCFRTHRNLATWVEADPNESKKCIWCVRLLESSKRMFDKILGEQQ